jgi:MFS family permease
MDETNEALAGPDLATGVPLAHIADGAMLLGHAHGDQVLLARRGAEVFAVGASCTHYHAPLSDGLLVGDTTGMAKGTGDLTSSPLRLPDFRRFLISRSIGEAGGHAFRAALIWYVSAEASRGLSLGHVLLALSLPQAIFAIFGGTLGDRYGRKVTIISCDLATFACLLLFSSLMAVGAMATPALIALVFVVGVSSSLLGPSASTVIPSMVPKDQIQRANALRFSTSDIVGTMAPAVAGLLIALISSNGTFFIAALCFLLSAVIFTRARVAQVSGGSAAGFRTDLKNGMRAIFSSGWLTTGVSAAVLVNLLIVAPQSALVPLMISQAGLGAEVLGFYISAMSVGYLAGSVLSTRIASAYAMPAVVMSLILMAAVSFGYLLPVTAPLILVISAAKGVAISIFEVLWTTALQTRVSDDILSRVFSVQASLSFASRALGLAAVGYATMALQPSNLIGMLAGFALLLSLAAARTLIRA